MKIEKGKTYTTKDGEWQVTALHRLVSSSMPEYPWVCVASCKNGAELVYFYSDDGAFSALNKNGGKALVPVRKTVTMWAAVFGGQYPTFSVTNTLDTARMIHPRACAYVPVEATYYEGENK